MSAITFGNTTIISSTEGGWQEPDFGFINPAYAFEGIANADGELAIPVSGKGCDHSITVNFLNVSQASIAGIQARIKSLKTKGVQTLSIPEWPAIPNCILTSVKPANRRVASINVSSSVTTTAKRNLDYTLTFRQLFE